MILHLMIFSKTSREYVKFLKKYFSKESHKFVLWKGNDSHQMELEGLDDIEILENKKDLFYFYLTLFKLKKYEKIIIHGWYYPYFSIPLFFNKFLLKRIYWCMWGADVYILFKKKTKLTEKIYYCFDSYCKSNIKTYLTHIIEEYYLLKQKYKIKGKIVDTFMYPSNAYKEQNTELVEKKGLFIQVGNSAEERNHLEVLRNLVLSKDKIEKIYLPLSYGDSENYINILLKRIPNELKDKTVPILKIMPYEKYIKFLSKIDIAIFPFKEQQAFGNIISLLALKKTVYLEKSSITYNCINRMGIKVKTFEQFNKLEKFGDVILEKNKNIIKERFSEKKLIDDWKKIFRDEENEKD